MTGSVLESLCGVWVSPEGVAHLTWANASGERRDETRPFVPFVWGREEKEWAELEGVVAERLSGDGEYNHLVRFDSLECYQQFVKERGRSGSIDWIRLLESQFLMEQRLRLFDEMKFSDLRRLQLDIETACEVEGGFSTPTRKGDRVLAIGLRCGEQVETLVLEERTDAAERALLKQLNKRIQDLDPDVIEGHNIFKFDLDYLHRRSKRFKLAPQWGRYGQSASFRKTRIRVAERMIDYTRCDIPGRAVVDTYLLVQIFDITSREMMSYGLKEVAKFFGVTSQEGEERTYIEGSKIQYMFDEDRETFLEYLKDDLRETEGVADRLLPTYFEQAKAFPTTLQEACLRGSASKVDLVFQEEYYHARAACPMPGEVSSFEGGYTASFAEGVYEKVLHFDVASLYPSLLLLIDRNPKRDHLQVFIPMLKRLREYRLKYKKLARETEDASLASEYDARQSSFKILINSFYGYLGFSGARFGDAALAAEVTAKGREILQSLIEFFREAGCEPLEADTDGIYVCAGKYFDNEDALLAKAQEILPKGIELEYDGKYVSMFCYKAKNYALYDGEKVTIRGSGLRSRGMEPFLKDLTWKLIYSLLGAAEGDPARLAMEVESKIQAQELAVEDIAKSEVLSQSPEAYQKKMDTVGKPRRASAEVALKMEKAVGMGDRVSYFIQPKKPGQTSDWQRAYPVDGYEKNDRPYDPSYYVKKLNDWRKRYAPFCPALLENPDQGELF
ncbi:DNA polymerase domain-containing protein [Pelagicoccus sp. SDUM812005]|uniref:DNA polymerase domain-containing protein n=1 Tax=Pelagicoccus sp. SDUM812005 TaxID=3041257 RepID=UPI00280D7841|nr:DNA polymerase domain-containing protein [Pelagicoccus sp. SDUM812005]MDQ8182972.1 DNA polymerase domain-containing protein [Pelagicoccus sp. SDUM812005]